MSKMLNSFDDLSQEDIEKERQGYIKNLLEHRVLQCNGKELQDASLNELRVCEVQIMRESVWGIANWFVDASNAVS